MSNEQSTLISNENDPALLEGQEILAALREAVAAIPEWPLFNQVRFHSNRFVDQYAQVLGNYAIQMTKIGPNGGRLPQQIDRGPCFDYIVRNDISGYMNCSGTQITLEEWEALRQRELAGLTREERVLIASEEAGINPVLLGMIVDFEWYAVGSHEALWYGLLYHIVLGRTFGEAQVGIDVAKDMFDRHPERFFLPAGMINPDGSYNEHNIAAELHGDHLLNNRVAAAYLESLRGQVVEFVIESGFIVSDEPIPGRATVTNEQIDRLTAAAYNQGWDYTLSLFEQHQTPDAIYGGIERTGQIDYVENVWGYQDTVESALGITYSGYYENP